MIGPYILAVVTGGILALLTRPAYDKLVAKNLWPKIAAGLVTAGVFLLVITPLIIFVNHAIKQGIVIEKELAGHGILSFNTILDKIGDWIPADLINRETLHAKGQEWLQSLVRSTTTIFIGIAANVPTAILKLALVLISCFFLLLDGKRFLIWLSDKIPLDKDVRKKVGTSLNDTAIATIWATLAAGATQSAIMLIAYLALGIPGAALAAGATFIFAWIPLIGSTPVWLLGAIYLYSDGSIFKAVIMVLVGCFIGLVDNAIRPIVLRGRSNMHPLVSLVAIFGGIGIFGIMGVFLGPIMAAIFISLLNIWPVIARRFGIIPPEDPEAPLTSPSAKGQISTPQRLRIPLR